MQYTSDMSTRKKVSEVTHSMAFKFLSLEHC